MVSTVDDVRIYDAQPPHCGLLLPAPTNWRQSSRARHWSWSNGVPGFMRPGPARHFREEAADIVHSELGFGLSPRKIHKLIAKSRITDLRNGGQHSYVSARRLFSVIRELQTVAKPKSTHARHSDKDT